jgi:hypothetical protein
MTVSALVLLPVVGYQAWSFHVFRRRVGRGDGTRPARERIPAAGRSDNREEAT